MNILKEPVRRSEASSKTMAGLVSSYLLVSHSALLAGLTVHWQLRSNYTGCHREEELLV